MQKPHYAWVVLGVTFLVLLASSAMRATPSVLIVPLEQEFGWSRTTISFAVSVGLLLYGLIGPFAAGFINRYGPRRMMMASTLLIGCGALSTIWVKQPWQLVALWGVLVGSGTGVIAIVLGAIVVQRWFATNRGLALGMLTASAATGQLVFLPLLARIVRASGWRAAVITMAVVAVCLTPIVWIWMRNRPEDKGLRPLGAGTAPAGDATAAVAVTPAVAPVAAAPVENPFVAALSALAMASRSRVFWILAGTFFVCGASTNGLVGTHLIPACMDHGIAEVEAAGLLAVMGLFDILGTTGSGWLSDRLDNRMLLLMYYGLRGLSLLYLPYGFVPEGHGLSIFAVFYGLDWIATVPPTVGLARREFGTQKTGLVFGWILAAHQIGAATAASFAAFIRTSDGSYDHAFVTAGVLCILAAAAVLLAARRTKGPAGAARTSAA